MLDFLIPSWTTFALSLFLSYVIYSLFRGQRCSNFPPGPKGIPLLGYLPLVREPPGPKHFELSKTYGEIVGVKIMGNSLVSLNSYETIKECFSTKGDEFSGRIQTKDDIFWLLTDGEGVIREEGPVWREHRRFILHTLRDFGFGKLSLEERVQQIGQDLITALEDSKGMPYDPMNMLANATFNVILYLTTDNHFKEDNPDFIMVRRCVQALLGASNAVFIFLLAKLTKFLPNEYRPGFPAIIKVKREFKEFVSRIIAEHEKDLEEDNPRDFVDAFLIEKMKATSEGREDSTTFTVDRLTSNVLNLLIAGSETTSTSLYWVLKLVSINPDVQERLQRELDEVVGKERLPSILDRPNLPYTDAFILEIMRYTTIVANTIPHTNPAPATLRGYDIPARTLIIGNLWAVHNDPKFWCEPEKFDPDRFMDPATKDKRRERVIPFAIGKRVCLGESLARMELFLFLTMLLQKFTFKPEDGDSGEIKLDKKLVRSLEPYKICAYPRT